MNEGPKIVDFNIAKRRHYGKCVSVKRYDSTAIMSFAQLESLQEAPGTPIEEVLLVKAHVSLTLDEMRELRDTISVVLFEADAGHG
jgi:hypothetical protein